MDNRTIREFLNGLDEQELIAVQVAALLGASFRLDDLLEFNSIKASKTLAILRKMVKKNVIGEESGIVEGTYFFVKKKFPNTVLKLMESGKKKLLLSRIIPYLEKELPADNKKPLVLAELYLKFGRNDKSCFQYIKKAADLLISTHRTQDALDLYEEIINNLSRIKNGDSLETIVFIDSVISYAPVAINLRPPETILPVIIKARSAAEILKNNKALAMLELCLGRLYQRQGDSIKASGHYNEGWSLAQGTGDEALLRSTSKLAALTLFWQGRMIDAIQMYERTLGDMEEISPDLRGLWAHLMLAYCYGITGRTARGVGLAETIRERAKFKGNLKTQAFADAVIALILLEVRQLKKAEVHINNALKIGEKVDSDQALWMAKPCQAYVKYSKGDLYEAQKILESAMNHARILGQIHYPSPWIIEILWSLHKTKQDPIKEYSFASEINRLMDWPDIYMKGAALRYHALDKRMSGADLEDIEEILEQSQKLLKEAGARIELGRTQADLAKILVEKKDNKRAKEVANMAYLTLSEIDRLSFPSELLSLITEKPRENRIFRGLQAISKLSSDHHFQPGHKSYLGNVAAMLTDMFGAERSAIFLTPNQVLDVPLNIAATRNFSTEDVEQLIKSPVRDLISTAIERKEPLVIPNTRRNPNLLQQAANGLPIKSIACIPLLVSGKVIGLLYADNRLLEGVFSKNDTLIMSAVATQVALFLKTTTLSRELEDFRSAYEEKFTFQEQAESQPVFPQIIGKSMAIRNVLSNVRKVSGTDATVLILGETGVGKELIAQALHQNSNRANKPFITVNVSALTENLLTNELFGHEKGAFTSAEKSKIGRFEMANQGTVFLDEIGDLSTEAQVKLLRVLQEGEFERVGGTQVIHSDFRLIAATNKNLIEMVARGDFRSDLFYRINIFPIEIPPLRERNEDIPDLALYFMKKYSKKHHKKMKKIVDSEMKKLIAYSWPGNIRELEHVIEMALILSGNETLSIPDFGGPHRIAPEKEIRPKTELLPLDEIERRHISNVLDHVRWRIRGEQGAAKILGLKPSTLEFRMKKLGIRR
ncbi:MAG: sigma 54-interacting transcriptional regulator [Deltaproteobacteria bacterium]|nr:sigma 54-interacting transcriptional regulator [Deltaproteobacteria bacterium]